MQTEKREMMRVSITWLSAFLFIEDFWISKSQIDVGQRWSSLKFQALSMFSRGGGLVFETSKWRPSRVFEKKAVRKKNIPVLKASNWLMSNHVSMYVVRGPRKLFWCEHVQHEPCRSSKMNQPLFLQKNYWRSMKNSLSSSWKTVSALKATSNFQRLTNCHCCRNINKTNFSKNWGEKIDVDVCIVLFLTFWSGAESQREMSRSNVNLFLSTVMPF